MDRLNRRKFLRAASGLFVPALMLRSNADTILSGPVMRTMASGSLAPNQITGLVGWWGTWDASCYTESGGNISQLNDMSGSGNHLTQGAATKPTLVSNELNGLPIARFNGTDQFIKSASFTLNQPETVVLVFKHVSATSGDRVCDGNAISTGSIRQSNGTGGMTILASGAGTGVATNTNMSTGAFAIVTAIFNGASSSLQVNATTATTGDAGTSAMSGFRLGSAGNTTAFANIDVAEVALYSTSVATGDLTSLRAYLTSKWAL